MLDGEVATAWIIDVVSQARKNVGLAAVIYSSNDPCRQVQGSERGAYRNNRISPDPLKQMEQTPLKSEHIHMDGQGNPSLQQFLQETPRSGVNELLHRTMDGPGGSSPQLLQETPRSDVDEILRRKRKAREYKSCYPCRQRKVKCDQQVPCKTCVVREHPELCTYHPPSENHPPAKRPNTGNGYRDAPSEYHNGAATYSNSGSTVMLSREEWDRLCSNLNTVEKSLAELKGIIKHASEQHGTASAAGHSPGTSTPSGLAMDSESRYISSQGIHTQNDLTGQTVHLGGSSVAALVLALGRGEHDRPEVKELLGKSILPIFGLDNENATYPFVDLWGLPHGAKVNELARALPSDSECTSFFRHYREIAHVVYPAVADVETFESELLLFLLNRASSQPGDGNDVTEQSIYGKSLHWTGMLFAALASGCQCSSLPRKERELTSQVYGSSSPIASSV
ncbi:hypothetical protein H2201_008284 [Coniosporium apollinis]|uniref:Zn(2)-C6 fungal-type domain-containing protein n=1 Tax=Coniosporium apollinis TaxID=61459 RepID=A0ABQ9NGJ0_9PEZI|nr:hypothetical protein H2201_008284 [Coniosporium apollinis]